MSNLEDGITTQGATSRSYDKYGKRMWTATPKKDTSLKDKKLPADKPAAPFDSNTKTSEIRS